MHMESVPSERSYVSASSAVSFVSAESVGKSLSERLKEGKSKRKKIQNTHGFFMQLSDYERELFAIVTEDISLQNTSGLQNIKRKLWKGKEVFKVMRAHFMILQLALNCYTVCRMFFFSLYGEIGGMVLTDSALEVCSDRITATQYGVGCFQTNPSIGVWSRKLLMQIICGCEAIVVSSIAVYTAWSCLYLLACRNPCSYAKKRYFAMMALPKLGAKFSFISFLHVANAERLKSFVFRGEFRCLTTLCFDKMFTGRSTNVTPQSLDEDGAVHKEAPRTSLRSMDSKKGLTLSSYRWDVIAWDVLAILMCGFLIVVALHALLVKLTVIYFAGIYSYHLWSFQELLLFIGFVNQLSGLSLSSEIEMLRILLFKFGGENTRWGSQQIEACATYFRYFAARTVEQTGRLKALVILWTMSSADLQSLFQGHQRLHESAAVREREIEMFRRLKSRDELVEMRASLVDRFQETQEQLPRLLDAASPESRLKVLNELQTKAVGGLRLACRVQEHIWEWTKVEILEADDPNKKDLRLSSKASDFIPPTDNNHENSPENHHIDENTSGKQFISEEASTDSTVLRSAAISVDGCPSPVDVDALPGRLS